MFKLKLKKYFYIILKLFFKSKISFYNVIIHDINQKLSDLENNKINNKNSKKEGK